MVSGVETSLIIWANSTISVAGLFPQADEDAFPKRIDSRAVPPASSLMDASVLAPFGRGDGSDGEKNRPFSSAGLNGLLAPNGIVAVQAENGNSARGTTAENGASDRI